MKSGRKRNALKKFLFTLVLTVASNVRFSQTLSFLAPIRKGPSIGSFHGNCVVEHTYEHRNEDERSNGRCCLTMRKQKASDRRTRRLQRGDVSSRIDESLSPLLTQQSSPLANAAWTHKQLPVEQNAIAAPSSRGRGRSRKRLQYYNTVSSYHNDFLTLLTEEYRAEEREVVSRLEASLDDPLSLELAGHALFDMFPERRGNLFSDEVYRLVKAQDATTVFSRPNGDAHDKNDQGNSHINYLPSNHKFSQNDIIMITMQSAGSGDFFGADSLPTSKESTSIESRVIGIGPTYLDVAIPGGTFESAFGPAPNNNNGPKGDTRMRLRVDRFFSNIPFQRMVDYLAVTTSIPDKKERIQLQDQNTNDKNTNTNINTNPKLKTNTDKNYSQQEDTYEKIRVDEVIRQVILYSYTRQDNVVDSAGNEKLLDLSRKIAQPPLPNSSQLANQVLGYLQSNPHNLFPQFNGPQLSAIGAALTRRLTMIQGPPGTGKTTVAASIAFGFVHKSRHLSPHTKVLACAFSNVGADNLAENLLRLGLNVVRVGKASGVSPSLWNHTLDAAIDRDPDAQKALHVAAKATANVRELQSNTKNGKKGSSTRSRVGVVDLQNKREAATKAVKASIQSCNIAATRALRNADVIVCTCIGAADSRLLAACGISSIDEDDNEERDRLKNINGALKRKVKVGVKSSKNQGNQRNLAPDNLPPLSLPFVIVDEACQSVEPATLIPIMSTDSCRSIVLLGDPCQLPPTVISDSSGDGKSPLSISLMSRLASILPHPVITSGQSETSPKDDSFLNSKATRQAISLLRRKVDTSKTTKSYRKQYAGAILLSVQYRMHPSIAAFSSAIFYDSLLSTPLFISEQRQVPSSLNTHLLFSDTNVGVKFINVGGLNNEDRDQQPGSFGMSPSDLSLKTRSFINDNEANAVIKLMKILMKSKMTQESFNGTIGVVTPYSAQVSLIKGKIASDPEMRKLALDFSSTLEVNTVDAYQGRERDIIIFSAVRSNRNGQIGFLKDWRRLNVALTRAKRGLLIVGDFGTLTVGDPHWASLGTWCQEVGCVFDNHSIFNVSGD